MSPLALSAITKNAIPAKKEKEKPPCVEIRQPEKMVITMPLCNIDQLAHLGRPMTMILEQAMRPR